ncbi:DUF4129 domain-containing protein [Halococcus sp. PRR34]|uniref:DUF4129 domain-containing protein n=1 Tax=Halococcus sp. PRR34 TaxID=3020830 RepID=UPI002360724D|nr:DUF4129 domain-containing protein [Halococcus sp. PRR34]
MVAAHRHGIVATTLLIALLITTAGLPLASATITDHHAADRAYQVEPDPPNNTTVVHEDPATADDDGNVSEVQGWLSSRLGETLVDCSAGLEVGNYDACNQSENYPDWLDKYVNVTRSSDSETNKTTEFQRARENQTEYANDVQRFRRTVEQYRAARRNGNTERAQRLARRAQRISRQVNETGTQLTRDYRTIDNGTSQNLSVAVTTTDATTQNVTTVAESVSVAQFRNTTITATAADRRISFTDPLRVSGRLAMANGTPLADRTIVLQAGGQTRRTTTDGAGRYAISYRPTLPSLDTRRVSVRYRPTNQSVFRSNRTSVPVTIRQVQPNVQAQATPQRVGFGDLVSVSGRVTANETGVRSIPIAISAGGQELRLTGGDRARTAANGRFRQAQQLPADIDSGRQTVRVALPLEDRALGNASTSVPITVTSTPTVLATNVSQQSVNGSAVGGPIVRVEGRLAANGEPLPNRSVSVGLNNSTTSVTTDENGSYTTNVTVPQAVFAGQTGSTTTTVGVTYDGTDTNLESSRRRASIQLTVPTQSSGILERFVNAFGALPVTYRLLIGLGVVFLVGYAIHRLREWIGLGGMGDSLSEISTAEDAESATDERVLPESLLETARDRLSAGDSVHAVGLAYAAVRRALEHDSDRTNTYTHWEFFDAYLDRDVGERRGAALRRLTELYERATFSQRSLTTEMASSALDEARTVADRDGQSTTTESDGETDAESES